MKCNGGKPYERLAQRMGNPQCKGFPPFAVTVDLIRVSLGLGTRDAQFVARPWPDFIAAPYIPAALSHTACDQAPLGALLITGSEPPESRISTVRS